MKKYEKVVSSEVRDIALTHLEYVKMRLCGHADLG